MATFSAQIVSLIGVTPTQSELDVWLTEGAKEIIRQLPADLQRKCASMQSFTSAAAGSEAETLGEGNVISVFAGSATCRSITNADKYKASDSGNVLYATSSDPAYYLEADKINVLPASLSCKYEEVQYPSIDADSDSSVSNFPDEAEYLLVLYTATKQLLKYQSTMSSSFNSDITTALTAINTELDETQAVCDLINTQVDSAIAELAEAATNVDSNVDTALAAITTAAGRVNTAVALANLEFDKCDALLDLGEADSEGAVNTAAAKIITELDETQAICDLINTQTDSAVVALGNMATEIALANVEIDKAPSRIVLAQAEILESVTLIDGKIDTAADLITTAVGKVNAQIILASNEFDTAAGKAVTFIIKSGYLPAPVPPQAKVPPLALAPNQ